MNTIHQYQVAKLTSVIRQNLAAAQSLEQGQSQAAAGEYMMRWSRGINTVIRFNSSALDHLNVADVSAIADAAYTYGLDLRKGKDVDWDAFPLPKLN